MALDSGDDGGDALEGFAGGVGIGDFDAEMFVEHDDELEGIDGIKAEAAGAEERLVVGDFLRFHLQHQGLDDQAFNSVFKRLHTTKFRRLS